MDRPSFHFGAPGTAVGVRNLVRRGEAVLADEPAFWRMGPTSFHSRQDSVAFHRVFRVTTAKQYGREHARRVVALFVAWFVPTTALDLGITWYGVKHLFDRKERLGIVEGNPYTDFSSIEAFVTPEVLALVVGVAFVYVGGLLKGRRLATLGKTSEVLQDMAFRAFCTQYFRPGWFAYCLVLVPTVVAVGRVEPGQLGDRRGRIRVVRRAPGCSRPRRSWVNGAEVHHARARGSARVRRGRFSREHRRGSGTRDHRFRAERGGKRNTSSSSRGWAATEAWLLRPMDKDDPWNRPWRLLPIQTCGEVVWKPCGNLPVFSEREGYCLPPAEQPRYCAS